MSDIFAFCTFENGVIVYSGKVPPDELKKRAQEDWGKSTGIAYLNRESVNERIWQAFHDRQDQFVPMEEAKTLFVDEGLNRPLLKDEPKQENGEG